MSSFKYIRLELLKKEGSGPRKLEVFDNRDNKLIDVFILNKRDIKQPYLSDNPGLYILTEENSWATYVGQSETGFKSRFQASHKSRSGWQKAIVLCGHNYNKLHIAYLEKITHDHLAKMGHPLENKQTINEPKNFSKDQQATCREDLEILTKVLEAVGLPTFSLYKNGSPHDKVLNKFEDNKQPKPNRDYLRPVATGDRNQTKIASAAGDWYIPVARRKATLYSPDGQEFTIKAGSAIRNSYSKSFLIKQPRLANERKLWLRENGFLDEDQHWTTKKDKTFKTLTGQTVSF